MALCSSSDSVSGGMAVGWASTAGTLGPMGDNHCCLIAARKETDRAAWIKRCLEKKKGELEFCLLSHSCPFFTPLHPFFFAPNPSFPLRKDLQGVSQYIIFHKIVVCVCVCPIICVF